LLHWIATSEVSYAWGNHRSRAQRIDSDAPRFQIEQPATCEVSYVGFRCAVDAKRCGACRAGCGASQNDRSSVAQERRRRDHRRVRVIQELPDHADLRMTRRAYAHLLNATIAKTVKKKLPSFGLDLTNHRKSRL